MKKVLAILVLPFILCGCGVIIDIPEPLPTFTPNEIELLDGSTATIPLSEAMVEMIFKGEETVPDVKHYTTHDAIMNVINGNKEIALVTHPSEEELAEAKKAGVELEIVPVVNEAFVFLVGKANPVNSLTIAQIQDIYSGKTKNWKDVGGEDLPIAAYQRTEGSGSQTGIVQLVMNGIPLANPSVEMVAQEMGGLVEGIAQGVSGRADAIGYSYYFFVNNMYVRDTVKLLAVEGITPNNETIASGVYPLRANYYAVFNKNATEDSFARRFLKYIRSVQGQNIAEGAGYVKL